MLGRILRATCTAVILAACSDSTGPSEPPDPVVVTVVMTARTNPDIGIGTAGSAFMECTGFFRATATGDGTATWLGAEVRLFAGPDRSQPVDTVVFSGNDIVAAWGSQTIGPAQVQELQLQFSAGLPWTGDLVFRYRAGNDGPVTEAVVRFPCEPTPDLQSAPPVIGAVSVSYLAPAQPSTSLDVRFDVTSAAGLWQTGVFLTGGCSHDVALGHRLVSSYSAARVIFVPGNCPAGFSVQVVAYAVDGLGRVVTRAAPSAIDIVDIVRPAIDPIEFPRPQGGSHSELIGTWFVGDTLRLRASPRDNGVVRFVHWLEASSGRRDSLAVTSNFFPIDLTIPIRPEWGSAPRLRFWASDAAGLTSDTVSTTAGSWDVRPEVQRPTRQVSLGTLELSELIVSSSRSLALTLHKAERRVRVTSLGTAQVVRTIDFTATPLMIDGSISGDSLFVLLADRRLAVVDLVVPSAPITYLPIPELRADLANTSYGVAATSEGTVLVSSFPLVFNDGELLEVDLSDGSVTHRSEIDLGYGAFRRDASGQRILLPVRGSCHVRYTLPARATDEWCGLPWDLYGFAPAADYVFGGNRVWAADHQQLTIGVPAESGLEGTSLPSAFDPLTEHLLYAAQYIGKPQIFRSRLSDGSLMDRTRLPFVPERMRTDVTGSRIVVAGRLGTAWALAIVDW